MAFIYDVLLAPTNFGQREGHRLAGSALHREDFQDRRKRRAGSLAGRRVPAPLPNAPAPAQLRAHQQLRLPRQPAAPYALAALPPLTPRPSRDLSCNSVPPSGPFSLTLELPGLRWNHECRRTAFSSSTLASLPLSTGTLREPATAASNHPRAPARTESLRLSCPTMHRHPSLQASAGRLKAYDLARRLPRTPQLRKSARSAQPVTKPISSIQNPRFPATGGFLQCTVSEAPLHSTPIRLPVVKRALQIQP